MTAPRMILPDEIHFVTHRCSERRLFMLPTRTTKQILEYCLAVAVRRHGIALHGYVFMANHVHLVLTDRLACLPDFMQYLSSLIARAVNRHLEREESFWSRESYNSVMLEDPQDVAEKMAYVLANPVAAGLVRRHDAWPGPYSALQCLGGRAYEVERPIGFFSPRGKMPARAVLELAVPRGFEDREAFLARVAPALERHEREAHARLEAEGRGFMGVKKLLRQSPLSAPKTPPRKKSRIAPRVAAQDEETRIGLLDRVQTFVSLYREAWQRWKAGDRTAQFPAGTWQMRVTHSAPCAAC